MSDSSSILKQAFELIDKNTDSDSGACIVVLGVEITPEGLPAARAVKVHGNPAATLASLTLLEDMIVETRKDILSRIEDASSKLTSPRTEDMIKKLEALDKLGMLDAFVDSLDDSTESDKMRKLIKDLKSRFGK